MVRRFFPALTVALLLTGIALAQQVRITFTSDPAGAIISISHNGGAYQVIGATPVDVLLLPSESYMIQAVAPEPYAPVYNLYHPYLGLLTAPASDAAVSIWIERTTAAEQGVQRMRYESTISPAPAVNPPAIRSTGSCCRVCTTGKPCGNTCINRNHNCNSPPGCAC